MSNTTFKSDFGERLKKAAKEAGKTQDTLSEELKKQYGIALGKHSISNHYAGQTLPDLPTLKAYCELLDVKADYLLFGGDDMKANRPRNDVRQKLDERDAKTAVLSMAALLISTRFEVSVTKGDIENGGETPAALSLSLTDGSMYNEWRQPVRGDYSFERWCVLAEQFQSLANIDGKTLKSSEKYDLAEKRFDTAVEDGEISPYLISNNLSKGTVPEIDDELPF